MDAHKLMKILKRVDPKTEVIVTINKGPENEVTDIGRWFEKRKNIMKLAINITKEETSDGTNDRKDSTEDKSVGVPDISLRCTEDREINTGC